MKTQTRTHANRIITIQGPNTPVSAQWLPGAVTAFAVLVLGNPSPLQGQTLRGYVPPITANLQPIGHLEATNHLNLAIGVPLRDPAGLASFLEQIYDPTNPNFRHYVTPAQFTESFGPTEQDYQAVISFANAAGLVVTETYPNRMLVDVSGTVADIERAFHLNLLLYQHPTEARTFYAPDVNPSVPLTLPLLDIIGLDNYGLPHSSPVLQPGAGPSPCGGSAPDGFNYMGYDFRHAYAPNVPQTGTGETVGLLAFSGFNPTRISDYRAACQPPLPYVPLETVTIDGFDTNTINDHALEIERDIEMVISMAPGLSKVIVYEATNGMTGGIHILNRMANDNAARALCTSSSWSGMAASADHVLMQMAAQGQSFFAASGDFGAFSDCNADMYPVPDWDPYACVVGGTTLTMYSNGVSYVSETVWSYQGGGSGGGISTVWPIPSWQTNINMSANQGSTTMRNIPDVAMVANFIYVFDEYLPQGGEASGTSLAAPLWAGFAALVNQYALANQCFPLGFPNPAIYAAGKSSSYTNYFHDVTTGNNIMCSPGLFPAVSGYDLCTGWGSPAGMNLIRALAVPRAIQPPPPSRPGP